MSLERPPQNLEITIKGDIFVPAAPKEEQNQDALTFEVNSKVVTAPKKELYALEDIAAAIGVNNVHYVSTRIHNIKKKDPTITTKYIISDKNRKKAVYNQDDFCKIVTRILTNPL